MDQPIREARNPARGSQLQTRAIHLGATNVDLLIESFDD
jgi:hypothetical protein